MSQAKDDSGNLRWFVYLTTGKRQIAWAPSEATIRKRSVNLKIERIEPAPSLLEQVSRTPNRK